MRSKTVDGARRGGMRDRLLALLALGAAAALLLAACGGSTTTSSSTSDTASASASGTGTQVTVDMTEFKLNLSTTTFTPGTYTFVAKNSGKTGHAIEIEGPGVAEQKTAVVSPGQSASLTVTFQAGKYEIYCPVGNHKAMGMQLEFTVGGAASGATSGGSSSGGSGAGNGGY